MLYFISDIHGNYDMFKRILERISFSDDDFLLCLGDMIDKGSDSCKVVQEFMNHQNMLSLMGNHEYALISTYNKYQDINKVNESYNENYTIEMINYLRDLPFYYEGSDYIAVHAGVKLDKSKRIIPMNKQDELLMINDRRMNDPSYVINDSKTLIFGHTPTHYVGDQKVKILKYKRDTINNEQINKINAYYKIHIDTGVYITNVLAVLCYETMQEIYIKRSLK